MEKITGRERLLKIFFHLTNGGQINPQQLALDYQCTERSIQRDLKLIRELLTDASLLIDSAPTPTPELVAVSGIDEIAYRLEQHNLYTSAEAFVIAKLLLTSRAFTKDELTRMMTVLFSHLDSDTQNCLHDLTKSEEYHYQQVSHQKPILTLLQSFIEHITKKQTLMTTYCLPKHDSIVEIYGVPLSLMFSENYFYVKMYSHHSDKLLTLRLDRFQKISLAKKALTVPQAKKIEDGIIRKKSLYMFSSGSDFGFTFRYWGAPEIVQDKFPEAEITYPKDQNYIEVKACSYEDGVIFWLLSQGNNAQVTHPLSLVTKMTEKIKEMAKLYQLVP